ncbi:FapA family protein [Oceanispirochaeta crateris]|nr:FapA family protein [Oceanispirochaeta crateris]
MLGQDQFQDIMRTLSEKDKERRSVIVSGSTIEDALGQAAIELGVPVRRLEYELLEKGKRGFIGIGKKNFSMTVYEAERKIARTAGGEVILEELEDDDFEEKEIVRDGDFTVRLSSDGAYLKVSPPENGGTPVNEDDVLKELHFRVVTDINMERLKECVSNADSVYVKVGDFIYNPINDARITVEVTEDEMQAFIEVMEPGPGGADLTSSDITSFLRNNNVVFGILEEALTSFEDHPVYNKPYLIAKAEPPVNGRNASISYLFEQDASHVKLKQKSDGSVDFKELNLIQNVVKGQPLARKIPPEAGKDGRTVYGKYIPAKDGTDLQIGLGKNVSITDNGKTVIATASGQVLLLKGKVTVETVLVIPGDVNASTGNVNGLGTVIIKGNVEDGFQVFAQGNIEVNGFVGKSNLQAGGDLVVKRGINGGEGEFGKISAGKSVWSSFINNASVDAGENVVVSDGIVNAHVNAAGRVLCKGKRARIVGGVLQASEEINAATLGSSGGAETILKVGYDPKAKVELDELIKRQEELDKEQNETDRNLQGLMKQKRSRKKLSAEKEALFIELRQRHNDLVDEMERLKESIEHKEEYLSFLQLQGKISASKNVNSGVKVYIKDEEYEVSNPFDYPVTFILEDGFITTAKYEDIAEEDIQRRD